MVIAGYTNWLSLVFSLVFGYNLIWCKCSLCASKWRTPSFLHIQDIFPDFSSSVRLSSLSASPLWDCLFTFSIWFRLHVNLDLIYRSFRQDLTWAELLLRALVTVILLNILHKGHLAQFPIALATPPLIQLLQVYDSVSTEILFIALPGCLCFTFP